MLPVPRRWPGATVVVVATGPSLTREDTREVGRRVEDCRVIAVNDAWTLLPCADLLYAADAAWWRLHASASWRGNFSGEGWTCDAHAAAAHGLHLVLGWPDFAKAQGVAKPDAARNEDLSTDARYIGYGFNSGFHAVNLAAHLGASRIVLLGFDMQVAPDGKRHFFGDHPAPLRNASPYGDFIRCFDKAAPVLSAWGIEVLNASRETALTCFPRVPLHEALR